MSLPFQCAAAVACAWVLLLPFLAVSVLFATGARWENDTLMLTGAMLSALAAGPVLVAVACFRATVSPLAEAAIGRWKLIGVALRVLASVALLSTFAGTVLCLWRRSSLWGNIKADEWFNVGHTLAVALGSNGLAVAAAAVGLASLPAVEKGFRQLLTVVLFGHAAKFLLGFVALLHDALRLRGDLPPELAMNLGMLYALPHLVLMFLVFLDIPALLVFATRLPECWCGRVANSSGQ